MVETANAEDTMKNKVHTIINIVLSIVLLICFYVVEEHAQTAKKDAEYAAKYYAIATERMAYVDAKYEALDLIYNIAEETNIAPELILAMIKVESNFYEEEINAQGCAGLMQISPIHNVANVLDIETNITWGTNYLLYLIDSYEDLYAALGAYNMGISGYNNYAATTGNKLTPYAEKVLYYSSALQNNL